MKITRLKRGYRMDLSDSEFLLLGNFYSHALAEAENKESYEVDYDHAEKRAWTTRERDGHFFRVDEDQRA